MVKKCAKIAVVLFLISLPVVIVVAYQNWQVIYRGLVDYPDEIRIATGPDGGLYHPLSLDLAETIENDEWLKLEVVCEKTAGSLENVKRLQEGRADFALYQPGTLEVSGRPDPDSPENVEFVANLYSQPAHFVVRRGAGIKKPSDLRGKRVQLGLKDSGDYAMSVILLNLFGIKEAEVFPQHLEYEQVEEGFEDDSLDAAFITIGVQAPIFPRLFESGNCELLSIDYTEALITKHISLSSYTIPKGLYRTPLRVEPDKDITTVSLGAQLLTRKDVDKGLVKEVTRIVMNEEFIRRNQLGELYVKGREFAQEKPAFTMHQGARSFYDPDFDIHIFESLDAIYSLVASVLIAAFLLARGLRKRHVRKKEHKLDRHMRSLLDIERRQVSLDCDSDANDVDTLQRLLDEVTFLRQGALEELAAHDLNEDGAIDSFIQMCHALSHKINAKISRQRLDQRLDEITKLIARARDVSQDIGKQE